MTLHEYVEDIAKMATQEFDETGEVTAAYLFVKRDGRSVAIPMPPTDDKTLAFDAMRAVFAEMDVVRYVFVGEAWMGEETHRTEVVLFSAEDEREGFILATKEINRPQNAKAYLGPLESWTRAAGGRMVGLLPCKGSTQ